MSVIRKKIVFILPALTAGGSERVMASFVNNLDRRVYDPSFIALNDGSIRDWINNDIPLHVLNQRYFLFAFFSLLKTLRKIKPDILISTIVHVNVMSLFARFFLPRFKIILRESSLPSAMIKGYGWKSTFCHFAYKYIYPKADLLICPSQQILDQFQNDLGVTAKKNVVLYNPVNTQKIRAKIQPKNKSDILKLVTVGRLTFEKGYDQLIEALGKYSINRPWQLEIIGEGQERSKLEYLIKKYDLSSKVSLLGHKTAPWSFVSQADVFLLTSLWEGMPNAALESLVCGTPVFALRSAGGIVEISDTTNKGNVCLFDDLHSLISSLNQFRIVMNNISLLPAIFEENSINTKFHQALEMLD